VDYDEPNQDQPKVKSLKTQVNTNIALQTQVAF